MSGNDSEEMIYEECLDADEEDNIELSLKKIEDFRLEPLESKRITRCKKCRRLKFGHPKPFGESNCLLDIIEDDTKLREDDEEKNKLRLEQRRKRKGSDELYKVKDEKKVQTHSGSDDEDQEVIERLNLLKKLKEKAEKEEKKRRKLSEINKSITLLEDKAEKNDHIKEKTTKNSKEEEMKKNDEDKKEIEKKKLIEEQKKKRREEERKQEEERRKLKDRDSFIRRQQEEHNYWRGRNSSRWGSEPPFDQYPQHHSHYHHEEYRQEDRRSTRSRRRSSSLLSRKSERDRGERYREERDRGERGNESRKMEEVLERIVSREEENRKIPEVPTWTKDMSCQAWIKEVEMWAESNAKPEKKAQALIEAIKKMEAQKGLKEFIINEIVEDLDFDRKAKDVVERILSKVKEFCNESQWTRMIKLANDFKNFARKSGDDNKEYVEKFSKLETQLRNEKVKLPNTFLTGILLKESRFEQIRKENLMATIDMNDDAKVLKEMKRKIRDFKAIEDDSKKDPLETLFGERGRSTERKGSWQDRNRGFRSKSRSDSERRYRNDNSRRKSWRERHPSYKSLLGAEKLQREPSTVKSLF